MSLSRYEKIFRDLDNSQITYVGTVYETDVEYNQIGATHCVVSDSADNDEYSYSIRGGGSGSIYNAEPYDLEYYFGSENWDLAEYHEKCGKYFQEILQYLLNYAREDNSGNWKTVNSAELPDVTSFDCRIMKSNTSEYWYIPNIRYTFRNFDQTITVMGTSITVRMTQVEAYLVMQYGTWDSTNNKWRNLSGSTVCAALQINYKVHRGAGMDSTIHDLASSIAHKIYASIGPGSSISSHRFVGYSNNATSYYFRSRNVGVWDEPNLMWRSDTGIGNVGSNNWNDNGTVEPEDPWTEPEPYPPTPPIPPTPDPPQPVDPVDPVPIPDDPLLGEVGTGFVTVYNPDKTDINQLARKFWDQTLWDILKQRFVNPFDAIIGLTIIPVTPDRIAGQPLVVGNYNTRIETNKVTSEYKTANLGSVYIPKFFNSYLDYDPYTKYQLFLPFIGEVALNADEITSKRINITYKVNVISGDCVAILSINNSVFAEYNGNCARQITVTKGNLEEILANAVQFAATAVSMGMSMGATGAIGDAIESTATTKSGELSKSGEIRLAGVEARMSSMDANTFSAGINAVMGSKMGYSKAGNPGQGAGQISVRTPFITITRPNLALPEGSDQAGNSALKRYTGYPVNKIGPLSSFHGLTIVEACQLSSQHATDGEIAEALEIMRGGVIL